MPKGILRVNYDEARQIAQTLRAEGEDFARLHSQTRQKVEDLHKAWSGEAAQSFEREMTDSLLPAAKRVSNALFAAEKTLIEILNIIRQADEETAGYFKGIGGDAGAGKGGNPGNAGNISGQPPRNMQELAERVMSKSPSPICVYQIGPNEYLVTIQGTDPLNPNVSHNLGSAIEAGLGLETGYEREVKRMLLNLPEGATVHLTGHSQGGIVAQNLAGDKELIGKVNIQSITTFGAPYSKLEVAGINYQRFAAQGDPVPYLEGRDGPAALAAARLLGPFAGAGVAGVVLDRYPQNNISGNVNPLAAHGIYSTSNDLKGYTLPFSVKTWNETPLATSNGGAPNSPLAVINKYAGNAIGGVIDAGKASLEWAGKSVEWAATSTKGVFKQAGNFFNNFL